MYYENLHLSAEHIRVEIHRITKWHARKWISDDEFNNRKAELNAMLEAAQ